jgi:hypothetical protein
MQPLEYVGIIKDAILMQKNVCVLRKLAHAAIRSWSDDWLVICAI